MRLLGKTATFVPHFTKEKTGKNFLEDDEPVTGRISFVNAEHGWFMVSFHVGGKIQREGFKFCDIGERVTVNG